MYFGIDDQFALGVNFLLELERTLTTLPVILFFVLDALWAVPHLYFHLVNYIRPINILPNCDIRFDSNRLIDL